jgi:hypothetical protein
MDDRIELLKVVECQEARLKKTEERDNERTADHAVLLEKTSRSEKRQDKFEEDIQHLTGITIALQRDKENMELRITKHNTENKQNYDSLRQDFKDFEHEIRKDLKTLEQASLDLKDVILQKFELISEDINKSKGFFGAVKPIAWVIVGIILTGTMEYFGGKFVTIIDGEKVERSE